IMMTGKRLAGLLLLSTALTHPALAQEVDAEAVASAAPEPEDGGEPTRAGAGASAPGGDVIFVTGRSKRDPARSSRPVRSVPSSDQIARTGEGNIAGALDRVTGLRVVGSGFVYVRGLGDRYSLAMLNGSPLPSPEPLR